MRGADEVDIGGLHRRQILQPVLFGGGAADVGILVVAVDAAQLHRHAVDAEDAARRRDLTETDLQVARVHHLTAFEQVDLQVVEVGRFGGPVGRARHVEVDGGLAVGLVMRRDVDIGRLDHVARLVSQGQPQLVRIARADIVAGHLAPVGVADHDADLQVGVMEFRVECRLGVDAVEPALLRHGFQRDVAIDAGQRPVVIGVEFVVVLGLAHAHRQDIVALLQLRRHVVGEAGKARVMAAQRFAVQPHLGRRPHAAEMQQHAFVTPVGRQGEAVDIEALAGRLVFLERFVVRRLEALQRPVRRHRNGRETLARREVRRLEAFQRLGRVLVLGQGERPCAVQRQRPLRGLLGGGVSGQGRQRAEGQQPAMERWAFGHGGSLYSVLVKRVTQVWPLRNCAFLLQTDRHHDLRMASHLWLRIASEFGLQMASREKIAVVTEVS